MSTTFFSLPSRVKAPFPILGVLLLTGLCLGLLAPTASAQETVSYDEFGPLDWSEKFRLFTTLTPENQALLARSQAERWLAVNRDSLSTEQTTVVQEVIALIKPELYSQERSTEEMNAFALTVFTKLSAVISKEEIERGFIIRAPYIPPPDQ